MTAFGTKTSSRSVWRTDGTFFTRLFPYAVPTPGAKVLELGQGVGWIMEAMLDAYPIAEIVGLDISPNMVERAAERLPDPRATFRRVRRTTRPDRR